MAKSFVLQKLEEFLSGHVMTSDEFDQLINRLKKTSKENLFIEFKSGKLQDSAVIRKYVSGFANSAGGVLVIGVADKTLS